MEIHVYQVYYRLYLYSVFLRPWLALVTCKNVSSLFVTALRPAYLPYFVYFECHRNFQTHRTVGCRNCSVVTLHGAEVRPEVGAPGTKRYPEGIFYILVPVVTFSHVRHLPPLIDVQDAVEWLLADPKSGVSDLDGAIQVRTRALTRVSTGSSIIYQEGGC